MLVASAATSTRGRRGMATGAGASATPTRLAWYVVDDRQMYRPGEKVTLKGWLREIGRGDVEPLDPQRHRGRVSRDRRPRQRAREGHGEGRRGSAASTRSSRCRPRRTSATRASSLVARAANVRRTTSASKSSGGPSSRSRRTPAPGRTSSPARAPMSPSTRRTTAAVRSPAPTCSWAVAREPDVVHAAESRRLQVRRLSLWWRRRARAIRRLPPLPSQLDARSSQDRRDRRQRAAPRLRDA